MDRRCLSIFHTSTSSCGSWTHGNKFIVEKMKKSEYIFDNGMISNRNEDMFDHGIKKNNSDLSLVLLPKAGSSELSYRIRHMTVSPSDVFTGRLSYTKAFFDSVGSGSLVPLHKAKTVEMQDVLALLTILGAFDLIARTGDAVLASPGFWVRRPYEQSHILQGYRSKPVIALDHLMMISGYNANEMSQILRLLFEDGAVKVMRSKDGVDGVMLVDGFINIDRHKHALRY